MITACPVTLRHRAYHHSVTVRAQIDVAFRTLHQHLSRIQGRLGTDDADERHDLMMSDFNCHSSNVGMMHMISVRETALGAAAGL